MGIGTKIVGLIGTRQRIYAVFAPAGAPAPFAVWQRISTTPTITHEASSSLSVSLVQVSCYATSMLAADAVRADIISALVGNHSDGPISVSGQRDSYESEAQLYRADVDFNFWDGS